MINSTLDFGHFVVLQIKINSLALKYWNCSSKELKKKSENCAICGHVKVFGKNLKNQFSVCDVDNSRTFILLLLIVSDNKETFYSVLDSYDVKRVKTRGM